ncbi:carbon-nitrogen family hydrolase [Mycolicibacterium wolinskyi]|uniref:carbon-nitrogen family hydrolase n=1 Tax=Mycolicibacterium wolinskyi TaxID=59750 RepID=UPI0039177B09
MRLPTAEGRRRRLRIALLQLAFDETEDLSKRVHRVTEMVAAQSEADLVVLPELWAHGAFTPHTWGECAEPIDGELVQRLGAAARRAGVFLHGGSVIESASARSDRGGQGRGLWNTSVVFGPDGRMLAFYRKIHRFGFGEGEPLLLEAGESLTTVRLGEATAGLATCYDLRFPELFRALVVDGAELFVVPAAWPAVRRADWEMLGQARALENQAFVIQCNTAGEHGGLAMGGSSRIVDPYSRVTASVGDGEQVLIAEIDLDLATEFRRQFPVLDDRRISVNQPRLTPTTVSTGGQR